MYIFRAPRDIPEMTFNSFKNAEPPIEKIGETVEITYREKYQINGIVTVTINPEHFIVRLYGTQIAYLYADGAVWFPEHGHSTQAVRFWLERLAQDNKLGRCVYRIRKPAALRKGTWDTSMYAIDADKDKPVEGYTYSTNERLGTSVIRGDYSEMLV